VTHSLKTRGKKGERHLLTSIPSIPESATTAMSSLLTISICRFVAVALMPTTQVSIRIESTPVTVELGINWSRRTMDDKLINASFEVPEGNAEKLNRGANPMKDSTEILRLDLRRRRNKTTSLFLLSLNLYDDVFVLAVPKPASLTEEDL
jgi:hypothetical protein